MQLIRHIRLLQMSLGNIEPFLPTELSKNSVKELLKHSKEFVDTVEGKELAHAS